MLKAIPPLPHMLSFDHDDLQLHTKNKINIKIQMWNLRKLLNGKIAITSMTNDNSTYCRTSSLLGALPYSA